MTIIKQEHRVEVENGKYTFVAPSNDDCVHILRHGEPWHTPEVGQPSKALHAIMCELDDARVVIQTARELIRNRTTADPNERLVAALIKHASLTGDHTPPSLWTEEASSQFRAQPEAEKIVDPAHQLMHTNAQMFEGTIRVLGQQNRALHEQVAQLTMDNVNLLRELEEARPKIDKAPRTVREHLNASTEMGQENFGKPVAALDAEMIAAMPAPGTSIPAERCLSCGRDSGDYWSQCEERCPHPLSSHYDPLFRARMIAAARAIDANPPTHRWDFATAEAVKLTPTGEDDPSGKRLRLDD